jgi:predicted GNAT family N-acyltransferase
VRDEVFVDEQAVPSDLERDERDADAVHFVALVGTEIVGTGRLVVEPPGFEGLDPQLGPVGHLGRLAVRAAGRGRGTGAALVRRIEADAAGCGLRALYLAAQTHALGFYERLGYRAYGDVFDDAGIAHRHMWRPLP